MSEAKDESNEISDSGGGLRRSIKGLSSFESNEDEQHLIEEETMEENEMDDLLEKTGFGAFHILFVLLFGLITASNTIGVLCIPFVMPVADQELTMSSRVKGSINAGLLAGMTGGTLVLGRLSDEYGRKKTLMVALLIMSLSYVIAAFSFHWIFFLFMATMAGVGAGGSIPPTLSYVSEFFSEKKRGPAMFAIFTFSDLGSVVVALLALLIMGNYIVKHDVNFYILFLHVNNWRLFILCCSLPPLLLLLPLFFVPESPSFLYHKKQFGGVMKVLKVITQVNKLCPCCRVRFYALEKPGQDDDGCSGTEHIEMDKKGHKKPASSTSNAHQGKNWADNCCRVIGGYLYEFVSTTVHLYYSHLVRVTLLLHVMYFTLEFVYLGDTLWSPEFFKRVSSSSLVLPAPRNTTVTTETNLGGFYEDTVFVALATMPGNILSILLTNVIGARVLLVLSGAMASLVNFAMWLLPLEHGLYLMLSCVSSAIMMVTINSLGVMSTNLYPTSIRSTGLGVQTAMGRIGALASNIIYALLIDTYPNTLMLIASALLLVGSGMAILLPMYYRRENRPLLFKGLAAGARWCKQRHSKR